MRAVKVLALGATALGAVLAVGTAQAQIISRSVSEQPVETTVRQTPNGTVVTRRPLGPAAAVPYGEPPVVIETPPYQAYRVAPPVMVEAPEAIDTYTTREVVRRAEDRPLRSRDVRLGTRDHPAATHTTRTHKAPRVSARERRDHRDHVVTRTVVHRPAIALSRAERHIVYQTIVEQSVVPAPRVVAPAYGAYGAPVIASPPVLAADEDVAPAYPPYAAATYPAYAPPEPVYAVSAALPQNVPLFAVPREAAYRVPAAEPYSYAYVGGRAYLVDPASGVIVADVTE